MNSNARQIQEKRKFSIVLRDPNEIYHRKGINQIIAVDAKAMGAPHEFLSSKSSILFTASRDRLIKLWSVSSSEQ